MPLCITSIICWSRCHSAPVVPLTTNLLNSVLHVNCTVKPLLKSATACLYQSSPTSWPSKPLAPNLTRFSSSQRKAVSIS